MEAATRRRGTATPPLVMLVLLLLAAGAPAGLGAINPQDGSALNSLKSQWTSAPLSWSSASDPCNGGWDGVTCSNGRVTSLRLSSVNIQGTLSDSIGQLSQLVYLDVSFNIGLGGPMPASIGSLSELSILILAGCSFTGSIPQELGNLKQLTFLALNSNKFTGKIPASLGLLTNLNWFDLADNQLTGSIPISTATMPGLDLLTKTQHL
jgi:Leucine-rich repeat (LRR) protein